MTLKLDLFPEYCKYALASVSPLTVAVIWKSVKLQMQMELVNV